MPDESCRKCGGLLLEYALCADCREIIQFICRICGRKTPERFHEGYCFTKIENNFKKKAFEKNLLLKIIQK